MAATRELIFMSNCRTKHFLYQVMVLGTPAEEDIGGKIELIKAGAFADVDLVFMAHPAQQDASFLPCVALDE